MEKTKERRTENATPLNRDPLSGSLLSFPRRSPYGDPSYRGNADGGLLLRLLLHYGTPARVGDPMEGGGTSRDVCKTLDVEYWGADLQSGFDAAKDPLPGKFDFVYVHPPYWNMIRYSDDPRDLSLSTCGTYTEFLTKLRASLVNSAASLRANGRLAVLVGDLRRQGMYTPIVRDVLAMEKDLGQLRSVLIKEQHNVASSERRYPGLEDPRITHEYCVIFKRIA